MEVSKKLLHVMIPKPLRRHDKAMPRCVSVFTLTRGVELVSNSMPLQGMKIKKIFFSKVISKHFLNII